MTDAEKVRKIFDRYVSTMKSRSVKWFFMNESWWGDRKINRFLKYYFIPIKTEDVIALMDTTTFRTGKEGILFTTSGIVIKEIVNKLYYLKFEDIERAEVLEEADENFYVNTSVWVHFKDGTKKQIFDYYINKYSFVGFINDVISPYPPHKAVFDE